MNSKSLIRKLLGPVPIIAVSVFFLITSFLLSVAAQKAQIGEQWFTTLLVVNVLGIIILLLFVIANFMRLANQYRKRIVGSRLMMRLVVLFLLLTCLPISVVYYFSAQFLSKGIDSWFDVRIEQALNDALLLGQGFLEASKDELVSKAQSDANRVSRASTHIDTIRLLDEIRLSRSYLEIDLYSPRGQVIATSNQNPATLFPDTPDKQSMNKAAIGSTVAKLEPTGNALQYRVLVPVDSHSLSGERNILQVIELLPLRYARLGDNLELAASEYKRLAYLREPLKISFLISLSLITIMTALISLWVALFAAKRLVAPLGDLAEGTRLVAAGDYHTRLPVKSDDELGLLVSSFNTMISQIRRSQGEAETNHLKEVNQRAYLQTVLSQLSSGVVSFNEQQTLLTANERASKILKLPLNEYQQQNCRQMSAKATSIAPLFDAIESAMNSKAPAAEEISIESERGKQIVLVRVTQLDSEEDSDSGWVVVFDDVTKLVTAQRDAAWGEVARRLAHEIKNPLTPIQLSAERIRRKYLHQFDLVDREALDRSTRTISEQVDTMKRMVDAFSNYARSERLHFSQFSLNGLIQDSIELNRPLERSTNFQFAVDDSLPQLQADKDALRQVLNNLISNALDATQQQDESIIEITIETQNIDHQEGVILGLSDNGPGFADDILAQIFDPYVTNKQAGTGLGMAIVKRIIEAHSGYVSANNDATLGGGKVKVWIPLQQDE